MADQTDESMGGFQCIPELFRSYDSWKLTQPEDRNHYKPDTTGFKIEKVRMAQYISMMPARKKMKSLNNGVLEAGKPGKQSKATHFQKTQWNVKRKIRLLNSLH
ncbi:hypothetical protein [Pedobacter sp. NJ-S-72]